ncbi:hypothetical protein TRVA0_005S01530 [Trichomonascus vanleenenianus]|uniref:Lcd1p n=1 Tax=Trichomonascus vanleenenianus TaxID=2268995 RepID=UPI003ECB3B6A
MDSDEDEELDLLDPEEIRREFELTQRQQGKQEESSTSESLLRDFNELQRQLLQANGESVIIRRRLEKANEDHLSEVERLEADFQARQKDVLQQIVELKKEVAKLSTEKQMLALEARHSVVPRKRTGSEAERGTQPPSPQRRQTSAKVYVEPRKDPRLEMVPRLLETNALLFLSTLIIHHTVPQSSRVLTLEQLHDVDLDGQPLSQVILLELSSAETIEDVLGALLARLTKSFDLCLSSQKWMECVLITCLINTCLDFALLSNNSHSVKGAQLAGIYLDILTRYQAIILPEQQQQTHVVLGRVELEHSAPLPRISLDKCCQMNLVYAAFDTLDRLIHFVDELPISQSLLEAYCNTQVSAAATCRFLRILALYLEKLPAVAASEAHATAVRMLNYSELSKHTFSLAWLPGMSPKVWPSYSQLAAKIAELNAEGIAVPEWRRIIDLHDNGSPIVAKRLHNLISFANDHLLIELQRLCINIIYSSLIIQPSGVQRVTHPSIGITVYTKVIYCMLNHLDLLYRNTYAFTSYGNLLLTRRKALISECVKLLHAIHHVHPRPSDITANLSPASRHNKIVALSRIGVVEDSAQQPSVTFDDRTADKAVELLSEYITPDESELIYRALVE